MNKVAKTKKINAFRKELAEIFKELPDSKIQIADRLMDKAAFMNATLEDMQEKINSEGISMTVINGNGFEVRKEHELLKIYNTTVKNFSGIIKQLCDMVPDEGAEGVDELIAHVTRR